MSAERPVSDRHALYIGWVLGVAMRNGVPLEPTMDDEGNYLSTLRLKMMPEGVNVNVVVPPPPDDWRIED